MPTASPTVENIFCPHCGQKYALTPEKIAKLRGQSVSCKFCHAAFSVRAPGDGLELEMELEVVAPTNVDLPPRSAQQIPPAHPTRACQNCHRTVGALEQLYAHVGYQVCIGCYHTLNPQSQQPVMQPVVNIVNTNVVGGYAPMYRRWSPGTAALLSFFIPGVGQMYKGQPVNGLAWLVFVFMGYALLIIPGLVLHVCCIIGAASGDPYR